MTPELASFSDWTLALLPRLFLYPGGLWLLVALLALRFASGGGKSISLRALFTDLNRANLLSIAVAWAALALAPFPRASTLPSHVDGLVLAALAVLSLLLDTAEAGEGPRTERRLWAAGAITLALVLPAIESGSLLVPAGGSTLFLAVSSLAVAAGLLALCWEGSGGIASEVLLLVWFCLGVVPLWQRLAGDSPWAVSLFVLAGVVALNSTGKLRPIADYEPEGDAGNTYPIIRNPQSAIRNWKPSDFAVAIAWLLALLGLLWALLAAA